MPPLFQCSNLSVSMTHTRLVSILRAALIWLGLSTLPPTSFAAPLGQLVREFDYEVMDLARDPVRARIYATTTANSVIVINTDTVQVIKEIFIGSNPRGLDVNADGSRLYVACSGSTTAGIGVVNLATLEKLPSLPTPYGPADVAAGLGARLYISPSGATALGYEDLKQISANNGALQATFGSPAFVYYGAQLALTPDRSKLFMGNVGLSPGTLARFDVATAIPAFEQANAHGALGSNGQRVIMSHKGDVVCYATGSGNGGYDIRLIPTNDVGGALGSFACGAYPTNGAFSPDDAVFYTVPDTQKILHIFSRDSFLKIASFPVPQDTADLVTDTNATCIYVAGTDYSNPGKLRIYGIEPIVVPITLDHPASVSVNRLDSLSVHLSSNQLGVTFHATGLPTGVSINEGSGEISGRPSVAGNFSVQLTVRNLAADSATGTLMLHVRTPFTVSSAGGGGVTNAYAGTTWQQVGSLVVINAIADEGFHFKEWTGSATGNSNPLRVIVPEDGMITANFEANHDGEGSALLQVSATGSGAVSGVPGAVTVHDVGEVITLRAVPELGSRFAGWSGSIESTQNPLSFQFVDDTSLNAKFESLQNFAGTYRALLGPGMAFDMSLGRNGALTAKLQYRGASFAFKGDISDINGVTFFLNNGSVLSLALGLRLELQGGAPSIVVQLDDSESNVTTTATRRSVFTAAQPTALAGRYTFQIPPPDRAQFGYGYGTAQVSRLGGVRFDGVLGDGTPFTQGACLSDGAKVVFRASPYVAGGFVSGVVHFDESAPGSDFAAELIWSRPGRAMAKPYAAGFTRPASLLGSRLRVPAAGVNLLPFTAGRAEFEGSGLSAHVINNLQIGARNTISPTNAFNAWLLPTSGGFLGNLQSGVKLRRGFSGVVFQKTGIAVGQHASSHGVGSVLFEKQ